MKYKETKNNMGVPGKRKTKMIASRSRNIVELENLVFEKKNK